MSICQAGLDNEKPLYSGFALNTAAFPYLRFFLPFPCCNCGLAFPRWFMGLFRYLDYLSISISETNCSLESLS